MNDLYRIWYLTLKSYVNLNKNEDIKELAGWKGNQVKIESYLKQLS